MRTELEQIQIRTRNKSDSGSGTISEPEQELNRLRIWNCLRARYGTFSKPQLSDSGIGTF